MISRDLVVTERTTIGRFDDQTLNIGEQATDLAQRGLSAVLMIWLARCVLLIALLRLEISLRSASLAIKPAGSSEPLLIRKPVLNRVKACCRSLLLLCSRFCATSDEMFVLILVMIVFASKFGADRERRLECGGRSRPSPVRAPHDRKTTVRFLWAKPVTQFIV